MSLSNTEMVSQSDVKIEKKKAPAPGRNAIVFLMVIALFDSIGLSIISPVAPFMTLRYLSNPNDLAVVVAWMGTIYGICQFLAGPILGLLSDRWGRRPILLLCMLGSAVGYLLFGLGGSLWMLFLSRIIDGLTAGDMGAVMAYVADVIEPEQRGKYFGLIGSLFGIGFLVGPSVGGLLATISYSTPFIVAAGIILLSIVWGFFFLPESLHKESRVASISLSDLNPLKQLWNMCKVPYLRWLLLSIFLYYLPFAGMVGNLAVMLRDSLGWGTTEIGLIGTLIGIADIIVQGILVGRLLAIFREVSLSVTSLIIIAASYVIFGFVTFMHSPLLLIIGVFLFAGAGGLVENALRSLSSRLVSSSQQGVLNSAMQSGQAVAMILGGLASGELYAHYGHVTPYWSGVVVIGLAIVCILKI